MKRILITGANSYIGTSFEKWVSQWPDQYQVDTVDMIGDSWRKKSFALYDSVFHVAGIAHSDTENVSEDRKVFYYKINTYLAIETAKKAKADGAGQFIFMSSAIVYGESVPIGKQKIITKNTIPQPTNFYGDSKLQAEKGILMLQDNSFNVAILRPPMIYGKGSKGNYPMLAKFALKLPIFPYIENQRSMLYIGNLIEFVRLLIENNEYGIFWPQNSEYTTTSLMVKEIAAVHGRKVYLVRGFGWMFKILGRINRLVNKAFGNLCYEVGMSNYKADYRIVTLEESIRRTEVE